MTSNKLTSAIRKIVYKRDGYRCALCDYTRHLQIHHVVPRGQGGPADKPMNMITLCSDCHALAHGIDLRDLGPGRPSPEDIQQLCIEYLADYYAGEGLLWNPWTLTAVSLVDWINHPDYTGELPLTRAEQIAWEHLKGG